MRRLLFFLLILLLSAQAQTARRGILILLPSPPGRPMANLVLDGIQSTIRAADPSIAISTDYIVQRNGAEPEIYATQLQWFRAKYRNIHFDAIVVFGPQALATLAQLRKDLWPEVPVVFCGVDEENYKAILPAPGVTGTLMSTDLAKNLPVFRRLFPDMKRIALIGGASVMDRRFNAAAQQIIHDYDPGIEIIDLAARPLSEIKARLAVLPKQTVVLLFSYFFDPSGQPMFNRDLISSMAPVSNAPIFETNDFTMGAGNIGGSLTRYSEIGVAVARIALRILRGEKPENIPVVRYHPSSLQFDWRELQRWKVPLNRLPPGSTILYRPFSIWEHYWWVIVLAVVGLGIESTLVAVLLYQRRRARETEAARKRAELDAAAARDEISHLNRIGSLGELAASLAHELNQPLAGILSNAEAAQRFLAQPHPDMSEVSAALEDIRQDDTRASDIIRRIRQMVKRQPVAAERVDAAAVVKDALSLLRGSANLGNVALLFEAPVEAAMAMVDPVQLRQVIMNLVLNALEAIQGPGQVLVRVSPGKQPGEVDILISDSGPGVPHELERQVFEPFFSTKKDGLGMGLSITASILSTHGGRIALEQGDLEKLGGATFRISLPSAPKDTARAAGDAA